MEETVNESKNGNEADERCQSELIGGEISKEVWENGEEKYV